MALLLWRDTGMTQDRWGLLALWFSLLLSGQVADLSGGLTRALGCARAGHLSRLKCLKLVRPSVRWESRTEVHWERVWVGFAVEIRPKGDSGFKKMTLPGLAWIWCENRKQKTKYFLNKCGLVDRDGKWRPQDSWVRWPVCLLKDGLGWPLPKAVKRWCCFSLVKWKSYLCNSSWKALWALLLGRMIFSLPL